MRRDYTRQRVAHLLSFAVTLIIWSVAATNIASCQTDYAAGFRSYQTGDYASAFAQWLPLAEQGDANSQNAIGSLYQFGRGTRQDSEESVKWYQKAANQGLAVAANNLGYSYLKGRGVAQDYVMAEMWFALAGPGNDQADAEARAEVSLHLTPDEMKQALNLAQQWRSNHLTPRASAAPGTVAKWIAGASGCEERWYNGVRIRTIRFSNLEATVSIREGDGHLFAALIGIRNFSNKPIDIFPNSFSIQITDPQGSKLMALPLEQVMAKQSAAERISGAAAGFADGWGAASQKRTGSATVTSSDGTTSHIDIYGTGPTPQEIAQQRQARERAGAAADARAQFNRKIRDLALLANTLDPQKEVDGMVYFHREKRKYREIVVRLPIAGAMFEFPFEF